MAPNPSVPSSQQVNSSAVERLRMLTASITPKGNDDVYTEVEEHPQQLPPSSARRIITFSQNQLFSFFDRIELPHAEWHTSIEGMDEARKLAFLTTLQRRALSTIPYENLTVHYTRSRLPSLTPHKILSKIEQPGSLRGGYCGEVNNLMTVVLRTLGFNVYVTAGRVYEGKGFWTPQFHWVNHVTIGDTKYLVDIGFGPRCPISPVPLRTDEKPIAQVGSAATRLRWAPLDAHTDRSQRQWVLEHRGNGKEKWSVSYSFTETEFLAEDFDGPGIWMSINPRTWLNHRVFACKFIAEAEGSDDLCGALILNGSTFTVTSNGEVLQTMKLKTEAQRYEVLGQYFGIFLDDDEKASIRGLPSALAF